MSFKTKLAGFPGIRSRLEACAPRLFRSRLEACATGLSVILTVSGLLSLSSCSPIKQDKPNWSSNVRVDSPLARDVIVARNMTEVQLAAEHFAADHGNFQFPESLDETFMSYFPGGTENQYPALNGLLNPFTAQFEFPIVAGEKVSENSNEGDFSRKDLPVFETSADLKRIRLGQRFPVKQGVILYLPLLKGKGYAIVGGAHDDLVLMDRQYPGQILVLSNLDWPK